MYNHSFLYIPFHLAFIYRKQKTQLNNYSTPCCWQVHILLFSFVLTAFRLLLCSLAVQSKFGRHFTRSLYATSVVCKYTIGLTLLQYPYVHSPNSWLWGRRGGGSNMMLVKEISKHKTCCKFLSANLIGCKIVNHSGQV